MNTFEKIFLTLFFIELFIGGGGRLLEFGPLSLRQVFFITLFALFLMRMIREKAVFHLEVNTFFRLHPISIGISGLFLWFVVSSVIGVMKGHALSDVMTDFFRVSFFAAYFPLAYYISETRFSKERIITLLKYSAFAVALFTFLVALFGKTVFSDNFQPYKHFWLALFGDDLLFRPSYSVFYKSHFYVFVGFVISLNAVLSKKFSKVDVLNILLCPISIFWSETRGFLFAIMVALLMIMVIDMRILTAPVKGLWAKIKAIFQQGQMLKKLAILLAVTLAVPFLYQYMTMERFEKTTPPATAANGEVNDTSASVRVEYIKHSKELLTENPDILIFGSGYGTEIAGRVTGIETSFLDILVEQGIIGLSLWLYLCLLVFYYYLGAQKKGRVLAVEDRSLLGIFVGVLLLTNINPFINNPIGIVFFLILLILSRNEKEKAVSN